MRLTIISMHFTAPLAADFIADTRDAIATPRVRGMPHAPIFYCSHEVRRPAFDQPENTVFIAQPVGELPDPNSRREVDWYEERTMSATRDVWFDLRYGALELPWGEGGRGKMQVINVMQGRELSLRELVNCWLLGHVAALPFPYAASRDEGEGLPTVDVDAAPGIPSLVDVASKYWYVQGRQYKGLV